MSAVPLVLRKKVCMLGAFAVGKTSLVARFVSGIFSEKYLTTVGVKIDRAEVTIDDVRVDMVLWDLEGRDELGGPRPSYLRGTDGCLLVVDGTRPGTLEDAAVLRDEVRALIGEVPLVAVVNKSDLEDERRVSAADITRVLGELAAPIATSAKTGSGVSDAFELIARRMLEASR